MKVLKGLGIIVTAIVMFTLPLLFPIITLPEPTGKYTVGTKAFHLIDTNRKETTVPNNHGNRELMIQVYYPAAKGSGNPSAYFENINELGEQLAVTNGAPYIVTTHLGLTKHILIKMLSHFKLKKNSPPFIRPWDGIIWSTKYIPVRGIS